MPVASQLGCDFVPSLPCSMPRSCLGFKLTACCHLAVSPQTVVLLYGKSSQCHLPRWLSQCFCFLLCTDPCASVGGEGSDRHVPLRAEPAAVSVLWLLNCHLQEAYLVTVEGNTNLWWKNKPPGII